MYCTFLLPRVTRRSAVSHYIDRRIRITMSLKRAIFKNPRKVLIQMGAAASASLAFLVMGLVRGWSSPGMPKLQDSGDVEMSEEDASWISSIPPLASIFGSLCAGPLLTKLGRKWTLILIAFPYSAGFLCIGFANHKALLYIGRILGGLMIGITTPSAQIFIGECASPRVRGALGSFTAIFLSLGILIAYVIGKFVDWNELAWILAAFPSLLIGAMLLMPETPSYLLSQGKEEEAKKSLQFYRGSHTNVDPEFNRLCTSRANAGNQNIVPRDLKKGSVLKPLLLSMGLMFFQQFSGINAVIYYTVKIFEAAGSTIDNNDSTIIVGAVQFVATICAMFLVDRAGRRILLLMSGSLMALSLSTMGAFFFIKDKQGPEAALSIGWLPLASLIVFIVAYSLGYASVPFLIMGELFPAKFRSLLGSLASCFNLACTFTIVKTFDQLAKDIGYYGAFWMYACCCLLGLFYVWFLLPETKGKSFEDIERMFMNPKKRMALNALNGTGSVDKLDEPKEKWENKEAYDNYAVDSEDEEDGNSVATVM